MVKKSNRKYRGLYVCSECGMVLNADINLKICFANLYDFFASLRNGALNILKKVFSCSVALNPLMGRGSGFGHPCRVRLY